MVLDIHTHIPGDPSALCSGSPADVARWTAEYPDCRFSVGIHPWDTALLSSSDIENHLALLADVARHPAVLAIGETGLDSLRGAPLSVQEDLFLRHVALSEELRKPLILHVVRQQARILHLQRRLRPTLPWIWHAYRAAPARAAEVIAAAPLNYLSFGEKFHPDTPSSIPQSRLLAETDSTPNHPVSITDVIARLASTLHQFDPPGS